MQKILGKAKRLDPKKEEIYTVQEIADPPEYLLDEERRIYTEASKRGTDHILKNFDEAQTLLPRRQDRLETLSNLLDSNVPIFYAAEKLNLSESEVKTLLADAREEGNPAFDLSDKSDMQTLLKIGMEDLVTRQVLFEITEYGEDYFKDMVKSADEIFPNFSQANQKRIIKAISDKMPHLWFYNLDYLADKKVFSISELLQRTSQDSYAFLGHYGRILYQADIFKQKGRDLPYDKKEVIAKAKTIFTQEPEQIFYYSSVFREIYTPNEQEALIKENLATTNRRFFTSFFFDLRNANNFQKYANDIREAVLKRPDIFYDYLEEMSSWDGFEKIFKPRERLQMFLGSLDKTDIRKVIYEAGHGLVLDFAEHPMQFSKFIESLKISNDFPPLAEFFLSVQGALRDDVMGREPNASEYLKKSILDSKSANQLRAFKSAIVPILEDACIQDPSLFFDPSIIKIKELKIKLRDFFSRSMQEYFLANPESLRSSGRELSAPEYNQAIAANLRTFAFSRSRNNFPIYDQTIINPELLGKIELLNPLAEFDRLKDLDEDYYQAVIRKIQDNPFLEIYSGDLNKIAKRESEINGPRTHLEYFIPDPEFVDLVTRIGLLATNTSVVAQNEIIASLPNQQRQAIMEMLEVLMINNLDQDNRFDSALGLIGKDFDSASGGLNRILTDYLAKTFEIGELEPVTAEKLKLNIPTLKALSIYYSALKGNRFMKPAFQEFAREIFSGRYSDWRDGRQEGQLEKFKESGLVPVGLNSDQYLKWISEDEKPFSETLKLEEGDLHRAVRKIFEQAITDQHIKKEDLPTDYGSAQETYNAVVLPMAEWTDRLGVFQKRIEIFKKEKNKGGGQSALTPEEDREYKGLQKKIADYRSENRDRINEAEALVYLARLQSITAKELADKVLKIGKKAIPFNKVFSLLEENYSQSNPNFNQDIRRLSTTLHDAFGKMFGKEKVSRSELRITDKLDLGTYVRIGENPVETCQHYNSRSGHADYNFGLLSYLSDPNVKIIQVFQENGAIIARAVMRLMEDESGQPQLFLERIYSSNSHHKVPEAVVSFAKEKAKKIGVGLYSNSVEGNVDYLIESAPKTLKNKNSRSPYVYTDAGGGRVRNGQFVIKNASPLA